MRVLLPVAALLFACTAAAQPTWRFHLAFEDGTGAKDTLWFIYDTTATLHVVPWPGPNVDYELGEGAVDILDGSFHVFTLNAIGDTTNTIAYPYSMYPTFETFNTIDAINWTPPMTITWDTSLFHAPYLPYNQGHFGMAVMDGIAFSQFDDHGMGFGVFNMLADDHVTIDFLWDYLFYFGVYFGPTDDTGIETRSGYGPVQVRPNPATQEVLVQGWPDTECTLWIMDLAGREVVKAIHFKGQTTVPVHQLSPGTYLCRIMDAGGRTGTNRLVVGK